MIFDKDAGFNSFAPPCGTASRSREIRRSGGPDPKPLRSDEFPEGLPGLTGTDLARVESAKQVIRVGCKHSNEIVQGRYSLDG